MSPFCQGFYILSNHSRKPHTSNSIIGWSTGESTGVPQKVQIGQTTLADGLFTEARSPLLCAAKIASGSCPVCFYPQVDRHKIQHQLKECVHLQSFRPCTWFGPKKCLKTFFLVTFSTTSSSRAPWPFAWPNPFSTNLI